MRWLRRILGAILLVLVLTVGLLFLLPAERIAQLAADQLRTVTGRDVSISGDVSMTVWPVLGVSAEGLEVGNAEWADQGPMLTTDRAAIGVNASALLRGEIQINFIEAASPTIRLEQKADGRASWQFTDASGQAQISTETAPEREPQAFSLNRLSVTNATLIYDSEGSDRVSYSNVDLTLDWPEREGPAKIEASLNPTGTPVTFTADIESFAGFITGQVQPLTATMTSAGGSASLAGRASTAGDVAGKVTIDMADTDAFFRALALPAPGLPRGLGAAMNVSTDVTLTSDRRLALRALTANLGGNALSGAADINLDGTPQINAQLDAGDLDLTSLTDTAPTASGGAAGPATTQTGSSWPNDPIDASGLAAFNGDIALTAKSIDLGTFKLGPTRALLRNDRSRMVFELREVNAYGGLVTGEFVVNNRNGLSVGGKMNATDLGVQGLLRDAVGIDRLTGAAEANLSFLGVGASVNAIMNSLSGDGALKIGRGTIEGIDLDRLMRTGDGSGGTTIFDSLTASYAISDGILSNEDLLLALRSFEARGAGTVGLGAQNINYLFTPIALKANEGRGLAIPIRIRGPWAKPQILPDLSAAVDLNLEAEKERIQNEVEDEIKNRVANELGVNAGDGQSLEDAAKQKLEDEVKKGLRGLFDR